jgi:CRP-like cAMP-binding protein
MVQESKEKFDAAAFLATAGPGRRIVQLKANRKWYSQGDAADAVFYLQSGHAKLTVVSQKGKEATVTLLAVGDFFGEESIAEERMDRCATASAVSPCSALRIDKAQMLRVLHEEVGFSALFRKFILSRGIRTQADLVDQLFNSSERRLARLLLLMADFGKPGKPKLLIPPVTQGKLGDMVGTTRSRVGFFLNRFRKLGYIEYNGRIRVNKSLLNVVLHDTLPEQNASRPALLDPPPSHARDVKRAKLALSGL